MSYAPVAYIYIFLIPIFVQVVEPDQLGQYVKCGPVNVEVVA